MFQFPRWAWSTAALASLFLAPSLFAQDEAPDRIAQVNDFSGEVKIKNAKTGELKALAKVGSKIKNSAIYSGDEVLTGADGTTSILFPDGSLLRVDAPQSDVVISEGGLDEKARVGRAAGKTVGRKVKVLAGKIWSDVKPQTSIFTEFETPSGVAAVKGTTVAVSVTGTTAGVHVDGGSVLFFNTAVNTNATLLSGQEISVNFNPVSGLLSFSVVNDAGAPLSVVLPGGTINMTTGDGVGITLNANGTYGIAVTSGTVEVTQQDGTTGTFNAGQSTTTGTASEQPGGTPGSDSGSTPPSQGTGEPAPAKEPSTPAEITPNDTSPGG
ncbi:MAG: FecR domain-containing protein [Planctomycetes bacterium]|nr:FecR domain-containing protein [Planctomycetota bacterium]